jgi:hypothetical protein
MVSLSTAEKDAITDGAIVFLGGLSGSGVVSALIPSTGIALAGPLVLSSLIAGIVAGLNTYRTDSNLPPASGTAPASAPPAA